MPLTDLVIARTTDAKAIGKAKAPLKKFPGVDIKGIDPVKLTNLHVHLSGGSFDDLISAYEPVFAASEEGPWVSQLPRALTEGLASLDGPAMAQLAAKWSKDEEFTLDSWTHDDVATVLTSICELASRAKAGNHDLFLWMSL